MQAVRALQKGRYHAPKTQLFWWKNFRLRQLSLLLPLKTVRAAIQIM